MTLPIDEFLPQIITTIKDHKNVIVSATPGAGKTTRLPVELSCYMERQIWVLEPRRIAALSAAHRIAEENHWKVGEEVGYQIRFANMQSKKTKILFLTEALLLKKLKTNPDLQNVDAVILDEFHERSIHIDLALAALKELQELSRPDLKIIVMSATLNAQNLAKYLDAAPIIDVPGKIFSQQIIYDDQSQILRTGPDFIDRMKKLVVRAAKQNLQGDILCFLPGRGEISRLHSQLSDSFTLNYKIVPLHGQLSMAEQKEALLPASQRKIILATNIAESALTVDGVRIVVDCGLARQASQNLRTGFESLQLVKISKASATQRAGRSARQGPGVVYRAWTKHEESSQKDYDSPEISRVDLSEALLLLANLGINHFDQFSWFEKPSDLQLKTAENFLVNIGALERPIKLTLIGEKMGQLPLHPRLAKLLIFAEQKSCLDLACRMAALLTEGQLKGSQETESDLPINEKLSATAQQMAQQLANLMGQNNNILMEKKFVASDELVAELLFEAYPDRLCRRRKKNQPEAKMVGGKGVQIHAQSSVKNSEYFLALEVAENSNTNQNAIVYSAVGLSNEFVENKLLNKCEPFSQIEWDAESEKFWTTKGRVWNDVYIGSVQKNISTSSEVQSQMVDLILDRWDYFSQKNEDLHHWMQRLQFFCQQYPQHAMISINEMRIALEQACYGEYSLENVFKKDLIFFFESTIDSQMIKKFNQECPSHWIAPTGNRFRVQYTPEQGPAVQIRLQEVFGLKQSPFICSQPMTFFLLAPNFRPVQVTRDLSSFWKNGYVEVRKEMRARYPKHSWPEDPITALPQSKGRPRSD